MSGRALVYDGRWDGEHGIGRFSAEVSRRLPWRLEMLSGRHPVSPAGILELGRRARQASRRSGADVFLSPGYVPPMRWRGRLVFTVHDLIHLDVSGEASRAKGIVYERVIRPAVRRADVVLTVSEFSRRRILDWAGADADVRVVGDGVSDRFFERESGPSPIRRPYILHVGNHKAHKNLHRLVESFADLRRLDVLLVLTGDPDAQLLETAREYGVADRLRFVGRLTEDALIAYYQHAAVVAIPSLHEGFGLPALEGMAAGVPVVASSATALPEVVGDVGLLVDPTDVGAIGAALLRALEDSDLRADALLRGPQRARRFSWDSVGERVRAAVEPLVEGV